MRKMLNIDALPTIPLASALNAKLKLTVWRNHLYVCLNRNPSYIGTHRKRKKETSSKAKTHTIIWITFFFAIILSATNATFFLLFNFTKSHRTQPFSEMFSHSKHLTKITTKTRTQTKRQSTLFIYSTTVHHLPFTITISNVHNTLYFTAIITVWPKRKYSQKLLFANVAFSN